MHQRLKFILSGVTLYMFWMVFPSVIGSSTLRTATGICQTDTVTVSDGLSVHHQEFKTVHTATGIFQTDAVVCLLDTAVRLLVSRQQCLSDKYLLLYVQSRTPDDGRKDLPKHAECHSKIK